MGYCCWERKLTNTQRSQIPISLGNLKKPTDKGGALSGRYLATFCSIILCKIVEFFFVSELRDIRRNQCEFRKRIRSGYRNFPGTQIRNLPVFVPRVDPGRPRDLRQDRPQRQERRRLVSATRRRRRRDSRSQLERKSGLTSPWTRCGSVGRASFKRSQPGTTILTADVGSNPSAAV